MAGGAIGAGATGSGSIEASGAAADSIGRDTVVSTTTGVSQNAAAPSCKGAINESTAGVSLDAGRSPKRGAIKGKLRMPSWLLKKMPLLTTAHIRKMPQPTANTTSGTLKSMKN